MSENKLERLEVVKLKARSCFRLLCFPSALCVEEEDRSWGAKFLGDGDVTIGSVATILLAYRDAVSRVTLGINKDNLYNDSSQFIENF